MKSMSLRSEPKSTASSDNTEEIERLLSLLFESGVSSSPFANASMERVVAHAEVAFERARLLARVGALTLGQVDLFALLVENAPEMLPAEWSAVLDVIAAEERFWVYPSSTVGEIEDGTAAPFIPYLSRKQLAQEWSVLIDHARLVFESQRSARMNALEA